MKITYLVKIHSFHDCYSRAATHSVCIGRTCRDQCTKHENGNTQRIHLVRCYDNLNSGLERNLSFNSLYNTSLQTRDASPFGYLPMRRPQTQIFISRSGPLCRIIWKPVYIMLFPSLSTQFSCNMKKYKTKKDAAKIK